MAEIIIISAAVIAAVAMRVYGLNTPLDLGGYDGGVYWQTLRAMHAGHGLYRDVFFSQMPFFAQSIYPFYAFLGATIFAARLGIAAVSLLGLVGAYLLGRALSGRIGGIAALALLLVAPPYLAASRLLEAEGPATAFLLLAVGAAFLWWRHPTGRKGLGLGIACGVALSLGILTKVLDAAALVPVLLLICGRVWQVRRRARAYVAPVLVPVGAGVAAAIITTMLVLVPFVASLRALMGQAVAFHIAASEAMRSSGVGNTLLLFRFLVANAALALAAIGGAAVAMLGRDWRIIPLFGWLLVTCVGLDMQVPLFVHHAIVLIPPLIAIAVLGLRDLHASGRPTMRGGALLVALLTLTAVAAGIASDWRDYGVMKRGAASSHMQHIMQLAAELRRATAPGEWVITDAQFAAALADRDTPPWLVDTSMVRVRSGYLTFSELIEAASEPRVAAVLFATDRLTLPQVAGFHAWVARHFRPLRADPPGTELWVRPRRTRRRAE